MQNLIKIFALPSASNRTKNRIKEHGPVFIEQKKVKSLRVLGGSASVLIRSKTTNWFGWIPLNEIEIFE